MKNKYIIPLLAGLMTLASCSDDVTTPVLELQQPAKLHNLSSASVNITKDNAQQPFPTISWDKANYGSGAVVTYTVTMTNQATGKSCVLGETGENELVLTNSEMNVLFAQTGAYPGQSNNYNISLASQAFDVYNDDASNQISFTATAYDPNVDNISWDFAYVAVGYPDWDFSKAYVIGDPDRDGQYQGWVKIDNACSYALVDGKDVSKVLADDLSVSEDATGFFEITMDAAGTVSQSIPCNFWGIIGDATSGGWSADTAMEYDEDTRLWTVIASLTANEFKFRANQDWGINYGGDGMTENGLAAYGDNIKVPAESAYLITMNLTNAGLYTYSMEETTIELSSAYMTLPGSYQGWSPDAADCYRVVSDARDFKYTGSYYFEESTEFKFYDQGSWIGIMGSMTWNDAHTSITFAIGDGDNIVVPESAFYKITVDTKKMVATMAMASWEVIGSATEGGWDYGQPMTYDPSTDTWNITIVLSDGEIKFRWDASWTINFGGDLNELTQDGPNIAVTAGTYYIVLDANNGTATMTMK